MSKADVNQEIEIVKGNFTYCIYKSFNYAVYRFKEKNGDDLIVTGDLSEIDEKSDYQATNVNYDKLGSSYELKGDLVKIPVIGDAFIYNSLVAFIIGDLFGITHEEVKQVLSNLKTEPHRMEFIDSNGSDSFAISDLEGNVHKISFFGERITDSIIYSAHASVLGLNYDPKNNILSVQTCEGIAFI